MNGLPVQQTEIWAGITSPMSTHSWAEAIETARENAVFSPRYALLMLTAGVIATFGIILRNPILIVGAMATSPDLLPLSAFCIGVVGKRPKLALRGVAILAIGMLIAGLTAWVLSWVMLHAGTYNRVLSPSRPSPPWR